MMNINLQTAPRNSRRVILGATVVALGALLLGGTSANAMGTTPECNLGDTQ